jgi:hypothetical protein
MAAFVNTVVSRVSGSMWCWEHGTWVASGVASGVIVPVTSGNGISGGIRTIWSTTFWSDQSHVLAQYLPSNQTYVKVTDSDFTSGVISGRYTIVGTMA